MISTYIKVICLTQPTILQTAINEPMFLTGHNRAEMWLQIDKIDKLERPQETPVSFEASTLDASMSQCALDQPEADSVMEQWRHRWMTHITHIDTLDTGHLMSSVKSSQIFVNRCHLTVAVLTKRKVCLKLRSDNIWQLWFLRQDALSSGQVPNVLSIWQELGNAGPMECHKRLS